MSKESDYARFGAREVTGLPLGYQGGYLCRQRYYFSSLGLWCKPNYQNYEIALLISITTLLFVFDIPIDMRIDYSVPVVWRIGT